MCRPLSMASVTAIAGERGWFGSVCLGLGEERCTGDAIEADGEGWMEGVAGVGWDEYGALLNWIVVGRLVRHCSSWWCSSEFIAGRGKVPESARWRMVC